MSGRDSLPHFPAPAKAHRPSTQSQGNMYQQGQSYQQNPSGLPGGYPPAGYQVGPPATGYVVTQQSGYGQAGFNVSQGSAQGSQPPPGIDPQLYNVFKAADTNNSGQLSELELSRALVNGDWTPFDAKTIKLMVKMFDADQNGTIGLQEFVGLWGYIEQWRGLFRRFDQDNSGAIDRLEFGNALTTFGYRLSDKFTNVLFASYDKRAVNLQELLTPCVVGDGQISFDMFVQSMVTVKTLTEVFKGLDTDRDGVITIGFEQFLEIILRQR